MKRSKCLWTYLIQKTAQGPDIWLKIVAILMDSLGWHVVRCSHWHTENNRLVILCTNEKDKNTIYAVIWVLHLIVGKHTWQWIVYFFITTHPRYLCLDFCFIQFPFLSLKYLILCSIWSARLNQQLIWQKIMHNIEIMHKRVLCVCFT